MTIVTIAMHRPPDNMVDMCSHSEVHDSGFLQMMEIRAWLEFSKKYCNT